MADQMWDSTDLENARMEQTWSYVDKSKWEEGPWMDEPDKVQWVDEATGLDCLIVRGPVGALCGYVGVPREHALYGKEYSSVDVHVHGGLTYADACQEDGHICHVPLPGRTPDVWWFGFDCAHCNDLSPTMVGRFNESGVYRSVGYVRRECQSLAKSLAGLKGDHHA